jgi:small subunit ribosomal protein S20
MPNIKSSKKDVLSSKIAYEKNKANKSALKTVIKKYDAALESGDKAAAEVAYKAAIKAVDQAVNKGLLHKNNAARKKSSMTLKLNKLA